MTETDLTRLRARFGDNIDDWPAPHRRAARDLVAGTPNPVHAALMTPTDEVRLASAVLTRLATQHPSRLAALAFHPRLVMASYAVLLVVASVTGYGLAGTPATDPLLALAFGDGLPAVMALQ